VTDETLEQIVRKVLAEIRSRGLAAEPAPRTPPAGDAPAATRTAPAAPAPTRKVFLTADALTRRLRAAGDEVKALDLAYNEFLTPAAMDIVHLRRLTVRQQPKPIPRAEEAPGDAVAPAGPASPVTAAPTLGLVIRTPDEGLRAVLAGLESDGIVAAEYAATDCWIVNTRTLCEAVTAGRVAAGLVLVPLAAEALVLANKVRGIRAVQGAAPESVSTAVERLAPNVLVIEHATATFHEIRTMVRTFAAGLAGRGANAALSDAIDSLERS